MSTPSFTFTGTYEDLPVKGTVAGGRVTCDDYAAQVTIESLVNAGVAVGYGPLATTASLTRHRSAQDTVRAVVEDARFVSRDGPTPSSDVPSDAVS